MLKVTHFDASGRSVPESPDHHAIKDPLAGNPVILLFKEPLDVTHWDHIATKLERLFPRNRAAMLSANVRFVVVDGTTQAGAGYRRKWRIQPAQPISMPLRGPVGSDIEGQMFAAGFIPVNPWQQNAVMAGEKKRATAAQKTAKAKLVMAPMAAAGVSGPAMKIRTGAGKTTATTLKVLRAAKGAPGYVRSGPVVIMRDGLPESLGGEQIEQLVLTMLRQRKVPLPIEENVAIPIVTADLDLASAIDITNADKKKRIQ